MKTYYAKELPDFSYEIDFDLEYEDVILLENRRFRGQIPEKFSPIISALNHVDLYDTIIEYEENKSDSPYNSLAEIFTDYFGIYINDKIGVINIRNSIVSFYNNLGDESDVLSAIFDEKFVKKLLRGSSQGDYIYTIYSTKTYPSPDFSRYLEMDFFGMYTEYEVHWGSEIPETADDVEGYIMRVYFDAKKEISNDLGCSPSQVKIFNFEGWVKTPKYSAAR